jgi:hypothetical protein
MGLDLDMFYWSVVSSYVGSTIFDIGHNQLAVGASRWWTSGEVGGIDAGG